MRPCRQSVGATLPARAPANKDSRTFLHARLALGNDVLEPCKAVIDRRLWRDEYKNPDTSVARARKPIADYRKAVGQSEGLAGLTVFYCERAWGFSNEIGLQEDRYFDVLADIETYGNLGKGLADQLIEDFNRLEGIRVVDRLRLGDPGRQLPADDAVEEQIGGVAGSTRLAVGQ